MAPHWLTLSRSFIAYNTGTVRYLEINYSKNSVLTSELQVVEEEVKDISTEKLEVPKVQDDELEHDADIAMEGE